MQKHLKEIEEMLSDFQESLIFDGTQVMKEITIKNFAYLLDLLIQILEEYERIQNFEISGRAQCFRVAQSLKIIDPHPYWEEMIKIYQICVFFDKVPDEVQEIYPKLPEYLSLIKATLEKIKCKI